MQYNKKSGKKKILSHNTVPYLSRVMRGGKLSAASLFSAIKQCRGIKEPGQANK